MEWWENYKATAQYYAENASMGEIMGDVLAIALGGILVAAMLPTALDSFYDTNVGFFTYGGTSTGTNDTATVAIFKLLPLFAVLGGLMLILAPALRRVL